MGSNTTNLAYYLPASSDSGDDDNWGEHATDSLNANWTKQDSVSGNEQISGLIDGAVSEKTYTIVLNMRHPGTITKTTTQSVSGACTATFKVNSTALGGTANSVSSSEQEQAHASSNTFVAGDNIVVTISSNSSCTDMNFNIWYTRTGAGT